MSKFYDYQRKAFTDLDGEIRRSVIGNGAELLVDQLVYDLTMKYPVSEKALLKRIDLVIRLNPRLRLDEGKLVDFGEVSD